MNKVQKSINQSNRVAVSAGWREFYGSPSTRTPSLLPWEPGTTRTHVVLSTICSSLFVSLPERFKPLLWYLDDVDHLPPAVPHLKLPHVSFHRLSQSHGTHLRTHTNTEHTTAYIWTFLVYLFITCAEVSSDYLPGKSLLPQLAVMSQRAVTWGVCC